MSHNSKTINDRINVSGEKARNLDTLAKLFQTMGNRPVS